MSLLLLLSSTGIQKGRFYILDNEFIPRPKAFKRESFFIKKDVVTLSGRTARDISISKERFILTWEVLVKSELTKLINIVNQDKLVSFEVTDGNLQIASTQVFPFLGNIIYEIPGSTYLAKVEIILEEEGVT